MNTLSSSTSDAPQCREVNGIGHRRITCGARVKVVARVIALAKLRWIFRITYRSIEVKDAVKCAARADPSIHCLTCGFSIRAVVFSTFVGCQCSGEYSDSVLRGSLD